MPCCHLTFFGLTGSVTVSKWMTRTYKEGWRTVVGIKHMCIGSHGRAHTMMRTCNEHTEQARIATHD